MAIRTVRIMAAFVLAVAGGCFAFAHPVVAADQIYVSSDEVFDAQCNPQGYCFGQSFCRKLKLHCLYARQACTAKYVTLPYTQPRSSIYLAPGYNAAGYNGGGYAPPQPSRRSRSRRRRSRLWRAIQSIPGLGRRRLTLRRAAFTSARACHPPREPTWLTKAAAPSGPPYHRQGRRFAKSSRRSSPRRSSRFIRISPASWIA